MREREAEEGRRRCWTTWRIRSRLLGRSPRPRSSTPTVRHRFGAMPPNAELRADRAAYHQGRQPSVRACNPALGIVELPLELAEGGLVDPGGRLNGGPMEHRDAETPRWSSPDPPACLLGGPVRPIVRRNSSLLLRSPPRPGTCRRSAAMNGARCSAGCVASTYSTCFATSSNPAARYSSPISRAAVSSNSALAREYQSSSDRWARIQAIRRGRTAAVPSPDTVTTASALSYALNQ